MTNHPVISEFKIIRPPHELFQQNGAEWLTKAHAKAEKTRNDLLDSSLDEERFAQTIGMAIKRFGCKEDRIQKRGHVLSDFLHNDWEKMHIYHVDKEPEGAGFGARSKLYAQYTEEIFTQFYSEEQNFPNDIIHVTCTGYNAPSAAQKLVSKKAWYEKTTVTHAYHMGCLASIPAIRMGSGFLCASQTYNGKFNGAKKRIDIVHTEICSLHLNPTLHAPDQLVGQSLFADGFIKYSLFPEYPHGLKVLTIYEEIIADSGNAMGWECEDWGLYFTLSKEVPSLIKNSIVKFIKTLAAQAHLSFEELCKKALFAIHPGGPKIIDQIREILTLSKEQTFLSEEILFNYGNMSSATLPHIWERVVNDPQFPSRTLVIGLAFGPGLTCCGIILEKV